VPSKNPFDVFLDLTVFAPLGLVLGAREVVPELAARGRKHLDAQVRLARLVGDLVGQQVRAFWGDGPGDGRPSRASETGERATVSFLPAREEVIPVRLHGHDGDGDGTRADSDAHLAIPDYDSLAASQVVPRLAGLTPDELDAVRAYEQAHRGRATVLGRIAQLQAG
jgi:hypothetical protein